MVAVLESLIESRGKLLRHACHLDFCNEHHAGPGSLTGAVSHNVTLAPNTLNRFGSRQRPVHLPILVKAETRREMKHEAPA